MKTLIFVLLISLGVNSCTQKQSEDPSNPYHLDLVQTKEQYQQEVAENFNTEMIDLETHIPNVALDIRYATTNNFTNEVIYNLPKAFARKPVANALVEIQDSLAKHNLGLKIYDAYRPYAATLRFYEVYPDTSFVACPWTGSRHNRGCAVDITLIDITTQEEIPMPTEFDDFTEKAHPDYMELPDTVLTNRAFLFSIMEHFNFTHYPTEWWHFDYTGWEAYSLMDIAFEDLE